MTSIVENDSLKYAHPIELYERTSGATISPSVDTLLLKLDWRNAPFALSSSILSWPSRRANDSSHHL